MDVVEAAARRWKDRDSPENIEKAALGVFHMRDPDGRYWESQPESVKDWYRNVARAVVRMLGGGE